MGSDSELRKMFGQAYNRGRWLGILNEQLPMEVLSQPRLIEEDKVESFIQLGAVSLDDGKALGIYELQTKPETKIHRNRVQMREIVARQCRQAATDGALAVYVPSGSVSDVDDNELWRFSFISVEYSLDGHGQVIREESSSKRYTYLLGRGAQTRTAVDRFGLLSKSSTLRELKLAFSVEPLSKEFYDKLHAWYNRAQNRVTFPNDQKIDHDTHIKTSLIRLITRLLFIWFIKEKKLVDPGLFDQGELKDVIHWQEQSSFYKSILQNLFFATLNVENGKRDFRDDRRFRGRNRDYGDQYRYRYHNLVTDNQKWRSLFARTPFLNGGLFDSLDRRLNERNPEDAELLENWRTGVRPEKLMIRMEGFSDRKDNPLNVPNDLFFNDDEREPGLIDLLKQYQFTLVESTPLDVEVALDPELLGKVFENLLAEYNPETRDTARKQTGSYYTPRNVVDYMVSEALVAALVEKVQPADGDLVFWRDRLRYLFDYAESYNDAEELFTELECESIVSTIAQIKVLDPAVGSGAFPMGVLHKLTLALRRLDQTNEYWKRFQKDIAGQLAVEAFETDDKFEREAELKEISDTFDKYWDSDFGRKLYLIQNNIFGVDVQPVACQIAKLRFFISLAIEQDADESKRNFGIKPLPNLEMRFVTADTLLMVESADQLNLFGQKTDDLKTKLMANRKRYFHATTRKDKLECRAKDKQLRYELARELDSAGLPEDEARKIADWDPYDQNAKANWFDSDYMFGVDDGFDVVIGNPPYIQLQHNGGELSHLYAPCKFDSFAKTGDIYCLFYEKANQLSINGGYGCLITSNKWMRAAYGKPLRNYLLRHTHPVQLLDMGPGVFDATVDTNILLFHSHSAVQSVREPFRAVTLGSDFDKQTGDISAYLSDNGVAMETPDKEEQWTILSPEMLALKRKIERTGKPLKEWDISIYRGVLTGCNSAFIIDNQTKERLIREDPKSTELLKPVLRGRDIGRYRANWAGLWLIDTHNGYGDVPPVNVDNYIAIKRHLDQFYPKLEKRQDKGVTPYNLRNCAYHAEFLRDKIVYPNMTKFLPFLYDQEGFFTNQKCFIITGGTHLKYLTGYLNSAIAANWIRENCPELQGGTRELSKVYFEKIPIPIPNQEQEAKMSFLVDSMFSNQQGLSKARSEVSRVQTKERIDCIDKQINKVVYELNRLFPEEVALAT